MLGAVVELLIFALIVNTAGVVCTATRSYTATGMLLTQTDGRGNSTTSSS